MAKKLLTSPKGTLVYPWLTGKADTKFKAEGEWKTGLRVAQTDKGAIALIEKIDAGIAQAVAEARKQHPDKAKKIKACEDKPYRNEVDDDDNPTGYVIFNFKMKASGKNRKTGEEFKQKPALFNAAGEPMDPASKIGAGSLAKISFEIVEFFTSTKIGAGVSLRMSGVQIITLIEWGGGNAEYHGFGNEEPEDDEDGDEDEDEDQDEDGDEDEEESEDAEDEDEAEEPETPAPAPADKPAKKDKSKKSGDDF